MEGSQVDFFIRYYFKQYFIYFVTFKNVEIALSRAVALRFKGNLIKPHNSGILKVEHLLAADDYVLQLRFPNFLISIRNDNLSI